MRSIAPLFLCVLVAIAPACSKKKPAGDTSRSKAAPVSIADRDWVLVALGERWNPHGAGDQPLTLHLESASARATGFSGCNRYTSTFALTADSLRFGPAATTRMACADGDELEHAFLAMMPQIATYEAQDSILTLYGSVGPLARFRASATRMPIADTVAVDSIPPAVPKGGPGNEHWAIVGHRTPGVSAMSDADATAWHGVVMEFQPAFAIAGEDTCWQASYTTHTVPADSLLRAGYRLAPHDLGLEDGAGASLGITVTSCGGEKWMTIGGVLLRVSEQRAFTPWDGVFFELERR